MGLLGLRAEVKQLRARLAAARLGDPGFAARLGAASALRQEFGDKLRDHSRQLDQQKAKSL